MGVYSTNLMGKSSDFSEENRNFKFTSLTIFLGLPKNKVGKGIKSIRICDLWVLTGLSAELEKNLWTLMLSEKKEKDLSSKFT